MLHAETRIAELSSTLHDDLAVAAKRARSAHASEAAAAVGRVAASCADMTRGLLA